MQLKALYRTSSRLVREGRRRVAVVATMALYYSFVPALVESLTSKQITVAGAWAQSTSAPVQNPTVGEEDKIIPTGEREKASPEKPKGAPEEEQKSARSEEEADRKERGKQDQKEEEKEEGEVGRAWS